MRLYEGIRTESTHLEEANTKFQDIFDNSNDSLFVLRNDGTIMDANKTAINEMGYTKNKLLNRSIFDLYDSEPFGSLKTESSAIFETHGTREDGTTIPVEISNRSFTYDGVSHTISIVRDISERKEIQRAISEKAEAEELNRIKSCFLANMSHELRTPLNSIIGFAQILGDGKFGELNEKQDKYTFNILKSGEHLLDLINGILDLSKVESGKMSFEPKMINLKPTIASSKMLVQPLADKKSINVTEEISSENDELYADPTKLKEILYNLLSNAIKFTSEGGDVNIKVDQNDGVMNFSISDNGVGIPVDEQRTIFDPFRQVRSSRNPEVCGTGLGLALVKEYVDMHGGTVQVESEVGKGSTFSFTIPVNGEMV
nr:PAS domain-containing sensor histidine kinase [Methanohalophilus levihalophilus]